MTPLAQERMLVFSPTLAATLGLEEAVLLYQLHDLGTIRNAAAGEWQSIEFETLGRLLPFWNRDDLQRIAASLVAKGVLETEWTSRAGVAAALCFRQAQAASATASAAAPAAARVTTPVGTPVGTPVSTPVTTSAPASALTPATPAANIPARTASARITPAASMPPPGTTAPALRGLPLRQSQPQSQPVHGATLLAANWQPQESTLQALALKNIPREFAMGQLEEFIFYWRERNRAEYAWDNKFRLRVIERWQRSLQADAESTFKAAQPAVALERSWYPDVDALQILERSGISREFIEDAIPEFVLYWREIGDNAGAGSSISWNSKFIAHVRRQWSRYTNALEHDQEPRPIVASWQPSEDVYDILRMANIDILFACEQLPEFILFWQDAGTPQRSWNTKFLQHIKYQWATRHHLTGANRAGHSLAAGGGAQPALSTFEQLTDRSWAVGLVDGI